jgi:hypothetical protein
MVLTQQVSPMANGLFRRNHFAALVIPIHSMKGFDGLNCSEQCKIIAENLSNWVLEGGLIII